MNRHVSTAISALGVLACALLLAGALRDHRAGGSPLWVAAGASLLLGAVLALVRDVRRGRRRASA
ncbi:hypothetical protein ACIPW5_16155 [Streptomyces sp. NPDC090077]|uniref:hypothetical protein n=1 Tax=Streptomyces sp. NPDC090077 TaxID=3365938 RepID=UPI00381832B4